MGPMEESWQNYERQRRRLNARLGLMVFALLPLPAILIAVGLSPLRMLLVVASLGVEYRDSVSVVVENEAQSTSCFGCGKRVRGGLPGFAGQVGFSAASQRCCPGRWEAGPRNGLRWHSGLRPPCCFRSRISPTRKPNKSCDLRASRTEAHDVVTSS